MRVVAPSREDAWKASVRVIKDIAQRSVKHPGRTPPWVKSPVLSKLRAGAAASTLDHQHASSLRKGWLKAR